MTGLKKKRSGVQTGSYTTADDAYAWCDVQHKSIPAACAGSADIKRDTDRARASGTARDVQVPESAWFSSIVGFVDPLTEESLFAPGGIVRKVREGAHVTFFGWDAQNRSMTYRMPNVIGWGDKDIQEPYKGPIKRFACMEWNADETGLEFVPCESVYDFAGGSRPLREGVRFPIGIESGENVIPMWEMDAQHLQHCTAEPFWVPIGKMQYKNMALRPKGSEKVVLLAERNGVATFMPRIPSYWKLPYGADGGNYWQPAFELYLKNAVFSDYSKGVTTRQFVERGAGPLPEFLDMAWQQVPNVNASINTPAQRDAYQKLINVRTPWESLGVGQRLEIDEGEFLDMPDNIACFVWRDVDIGGNQGRTLVPQPCNQVLEGLPGKPITVVSDWAALSAGTWTGAEAYLYILTDADGSGSSRYKGPGELASEIKDKLDPTLWKAIGSYTSLQIIPKSYQVAAIVISSDGGGEQTLIYPRMTSPVEIAY